ncbi:hypothetical protein S83_037912, partial [Arachis hypogaea]
MLLKSKDMMEKVRVVALMIDAFVVVEKNIMTIYSSCFIDSDSNVTSSSSNPTEIIKLFSHHPSQIQLYLHPALPLKSLLLISEKDAKDAGSLGSTFRRAIKLNVDGSSRRNPGRAECGGLLRDQDGNCIAGFVSYIGFADSVEAELMAIRHGLWLAWQSGYRKVECEMDEVSQKLNRIPLNVAGHPVGLQARVSEFRSVERCTELKNLPSVLKLPSLGCIALNGCSQLEKFPELLGEMENLRIIEVEETAIQELPSCIINFSSLEVLVLKCCTNLKELPINIDMLPNLQLLDISGCPQLQLFTKKLR